MTPPVGTSLAASTARVFAVLTGVARVGIGNVFGLAVFFGFSMTQVFCPRCGDLYYPSGYVRACDGAFWGTTLPHLLLLGWPELRTAPNTHHYVPRVYGFKIHAQARESGLENTRSNGAHRGEEGDQTKGAART